MLSVSTAQEGDSMEVVHPRCCGIDVHQASLRVDLDTSESAEIEDDPSLTVPVPATLWPPPRFR